MTRRAPTRPRPATLAVAAACALALVTLPLPLPRPLPDLGPAAADATIVSGFSAAGSNPVAPGVDHAWGTVVTGYGHQHVNVVSVDPAAKELAIESALSNDRVGGLERTTAMAIRRSAEGHRVVAAINADVWGGYSSLLSHAPNGIHVEAGELVTADASSRPVFGVMKDGSVRLEAARETLTLTSPSGATWPIGRLNQAPGGALALFSPRFGPNLSTALGGVEVVLGRVGLPLTPVGSWRGTVTTMRAAGTGAAIDAGTLVLVAPADSPLLADLTTGVQVSLAASITSGWEHVQHAVSGRGFLVRGGAVSISPRPSDAPYTHPRSALGLTGDGRLLLVSVDGRQSDSRGVSLDDLAAILLGRGAVTAINLDGGSSSTLAVRRPGDVNVSIANDPSAGYEINVTNSLQVVLTVPTGPLARLTLSPSSSRLYPGQGTSFSVVAQDAAYNPVPLSSGDLAWSVEGGIGRVDAGGRFTATAAGLGAVVVSAKGVTGRAAIDVRPDTTPPAVGSPRAFAPVGVALGETIPMRVAWPAATETQSGIAGYELERSVDGGVFSPMPLPSPLATVVSLGLPRAHAYVFRVRARDRAGNVSAWAKAPAFLLAVPQESTRALTFVKGTWSKISSDAFDRLAARATKTTGAVATFTFTGTSVAWIAVRSPLRGKATVSVDGGPPVTIDLYAATSTTKLVVFSRVWGASGKHTLTISALGTSGRPRIDLDAFVVLAPA